MLFSLQVLKYVKERLKSLKYKLWSWWTNLLSIRKISLSGLSYKYSMKLIMMHANWFEHNIYQ